MTGCSDTTLMRFRYDPVDYPAQMKRLTAGNGLTKETRTAGRKKMFCVSSATLYPNLPIVTG
jgi:hypothetical protein